MNKSEWITDRLPRFFDSSISGHVRVKCEDNRTCAKKFNAVVEGEAWMQMQISETETGNARYDVTTYGIYFAVYDWQNSRMVATNLPTRYCAERIAATYSEVMP